MRVPHVRAAPHRTVLRGGCLILALALLGGSAGAVRAQQPDSGLVAPGAQAPAPARVTLRGLLHVDHVSGDPADTPPQEGFGLRRVRLIADVRPTPRTAARVMLDPSVLAVGPEGATPFRGAPLVEAYGEFRPAGTEDLAVRFGQQRLPFGLAASTAAPSLALPEYPLASRILIQRVSAFRDAGLAVAGRWSRVEAGLGVFNGAGINTRGDNDDVRDVVGRVRVGILPRWSVGASGWRGRSGRLPRLEGTPRRTFHDQANFRRWGLDSRYAHAGLEISAEYLRDRTDHNGAAEHPVPNESGLTRSGAYLAGAARVGRRFELAARYDRWDPDHAAAADEVTELTAGMSLFLQRDARPDHPSLGTPLNAVQRLSRVLLFAEHVRPETGETQTRLRLRLEVFY